MLPRLAKPAKLHRHGSRLGLGASSPRLTFIVSAQVASPKSGPGDEDRKAWNAQLRQMALSSRSQELSREIDDVLLLLRDRISEKSEKTVQVLP